VSLVVSPVNGIRKTYAKINPSITVVPSPEIVAPCDLKFEFTADDWISVCGYYFQAVLLGHSTQLRLRNNRASHTGSIARVASGNYLNSPQFGFADLISADSALNHLNKGTENPVTLV